MSYSIESIEQLVELWTNIYNREGHPDWSSILPYYDENIQFKDTVQELHGLDNFKQMTERLSERAKNLKMVITNRAREQNIFFLEWEMTLSFKKYPDSTLYGASRVILNSAGMIIEQRDYYDLWGDIFDNIPRFNKAYRKFMKKKFG